MGAKNVAELMHSIGANAKAASAELAYASGERKHVALIGAANAMINRMDDILAANVKDLDYGLDKGLSPAMMDRLMLDKERVLAMANGVSSLSSEFRFRPIYWRWRLATWRLSRLVPVPRFGASPRWSRRVRLNSPRLRISSRRLSRSQVRTCGGVTTFSSCRLRSLTAGWRTRV